MYSEEEIRKAWKFKLSELEGWITSGQGVGEMVKIL